MFLDIWQCHSYLSNNSFSLSVGYIYMFWIFQNLVSHLELFFGVCFQIKHQVDMQSWDCIFLRNFVLSGRICLVIEANCELSQGFLKITKNMLIFMEQIMPGIDNGKVVMTITSNNWEFLKLSLMLHP